MTVNLTELKQSSDALGIRVVTNSERYRIDQELAKMFGSEAIDIGSFLDDNMQQLNILSMGGSIPGWGGFNIPGFYAVAGFDGIAPNAQQRAIRIATPGTENIYLFDDISASRLRYAVAHELLHGSPGIIKSASDALEYLKDNGHSYLNSLSNDDKKELLAALEHASLSMTLDMMRAAAPALLSNIGYQTTRSYVEFAASMLAHIKAHGSLDGWDEPSPNFNIGMDESLPSGTIVDEDGTAIGFIDSSGNIGTTLPGHSYSAGMLNEYGVVSDTGVASMTLGGHLRAFGDWIGLDGEVGIQGTYSLDGEGVDGTAGSGTNGDPGGEGVHTPSEAELEEAETACPVVIDLDGDGVEINVNASIQFDFDTDGYLEAGAWVGADDGFLVIDRASEDGSLAPDNVITRGDELALSMLTLNNTNDTDLQALKNSWMNSDHSTVAVTGPDGVTRQVEVFNDKDDGWDYVRVWRDLDQDGVVDGGLNTENNANGELFTLKALGITQINLGYDDGSAFTTHNDDITVGLATLNGLASFVRDGVTIEGGVGDVALGHADLGYQRVAIPNVAGGFELQFEDGRRWRSLDLAGQTSAHADLEALVMDGAQGDGRANNLDAGGHARSVQIEGGGGADTINGGAAADLLAGGAGADKLRGHNGDDLIVIDVDDLGAAGEVLGGGGIDTLMVADDRAVTLILDARQAEVGIGGGGSDSIRATAENDVVYDNIQISGRDGNDSLAGSAGDDILSGDSGNDRISGQLGDDFLSGGLGHDGMIGGSGDDQLSGGDGADSLSGEGDDDLLSGGSGHDILHGGTGDDRLFGNGDHDQLYAGIGDDTLEGGSHNDILSFWRGDAMLSGGTGDDSFRLQQLTEHGTLGSWGWSVLFGGAGNDTLVLDGDSSEWQRRHIGGNQWQFYRMVSASEKVVIDVVDIERIDFSGTGNDLVLGSFSTANTSDDYLRRSWSAGTGNDVGGELVNGVICGFMGDDQLSIGSYTAQSSNGGSGSDTLSGGTGNDTLTGESGQDALSAGAGSDSINSGNGTDQISGGTGNDSVIAGSGSDIVQGDGGNDSAYGGSGADVMLGGSGADALYGGTGADQLSGGSEGDSLYGDTGYDKLYGDEGADKLFGGAGSDYLYGGAGNDTLQGDDTLGGGHNYLAGGEGDDKLFGGTFEDQLAGEEGNDSLFGGDGRDILLGGEGNDSLDGGDSILDLASFQGAEAGVSVDLDAKTASGTDIGNDTLSGIEQAMGGSGNDTLRGSSLVSENGITSGGDNLLIGGAGDDLLDGRTGDDDLLGGAGNDTLWGRDGVDRLYGDDGNDTLDGALGEDTLTGGAGADNLLAGAGNDLLYGEAGADTLIGSSGNDTLNGGSGNDLLEGGTGDDTYVITEQEVITEAVDAGTDLVVSAVSVTLGANLEHLDLTGTAAINGTGNGFDNRITGNTGNNILTGGGGADTLIGGDGNDTYVVSGADTVTEQANTSTDTSPGIDTVNSGGSYTLGANLENLILTGTAAINGNGNSLSNRLTGNGANNTLNGGGGADTLVGGDGRDLLYGWDDNSRDVFVFNAIGETDVGASARDVVYDFVSGQDDLDLRGIDANHDMAGDQLFSFNTTTAKAYSVWFVVSGTDVIVRGDVNGNTTADFEIQLSGVSVLGGGDFLL